MYLSHYNLTEKPFQLTPDPRFLWLGEVHKEALATLRYGILENRGLLLLVGDVGTGKTMLINGLLNTLDEDTVVATVFDPGLEKIEFFNFLAHAFKLDKHFDNKGDFLVHFIHFLNKIHAEGKKALLIIDEAQRLTPEMLEEVRLLSNIEKQDAKLLNIFLVGQDELLDTLADKKSRAFMHRISSSYNIKPLKKTELEDYIRFRLKIAGTEKKIFTKSAMHSIASYSECYPRLINKICDQALLTGYVNNKTKINAKIVNECLKDLQILSMNRKRKSGRSGTFAWKPFMYGLIPVLIAAVLGGYFYLKNIREDIPLSAGRPVSEKQSKEPAVKDTSPPVFPDQNNGNKKVKLQPVKESRTSTDSSKKQADLQTPPQPVKEKQATETNRISTAPVKKTPLEPVKPPGQEFKKKPLSVPDKKTSINLPFDSVTLSDESYAVINRLSEIAAQNPDFDIHIKGYTDSSGSKQYNKKLSKFRAQFFKSYFIGRGINPARILTFGMGPQNPVASNATLKGKKANRRVEIEFRKKVP